ncbi:MAG: type IV pilus assembly protein PilM [Myxococcales bacterium]|nr:type IV pilus assembly protein PilM [Myxococcales bacterium]
MARHCIGLDIGSTAIKLVQLRPGRNGHALERFGVQPVPARAIVDGAVAQPERVVAALRELVARTGPRGRDVALAVTGNGVIVKRISVPRLEPAAFAQQVEWEARQIVAPRSRDDVLIDHTPLRQNPMTGEVEVLLVVAKKDLVGQYTRVVQDAGLRPVVVDATAFTLQNCVEASLGLTQGETLAVVNVGATASTICIIVEGMPAYGRDLSSGGHSYTDALARSFGLGEEEAERIKRGEQPPDDPLLFERTMHQVSEAIAAEVHRSLMFFLGSVNDNSPARIVLAGGSALVPSLRPALAERSRLPVALLDPFARVQVDPRRVDLAALRTCAPIAAVAFGLALRAEGDSP